jgi:hypothetical protein
VRIVISREKIQCALDGCEVMFTPYRPNHLYCSKKHTDAACYQKWTRKVPRRVVRTAKMSDTGRSESRKRLKASAYATETYSIRCMAKGLELLAREWPAFFLRLLASVEADSHPYIAADSARVAA